jgi:hypothetical protein
MTAPTDLDDLFNPTYDAGVRIHCNSWGCDSCSPSHPHFALDLIPVVEQRIPLDSPATFTKVKHKPLIGATYTDGLN